MSEIQGQRELLAKLRALLPSEEDEISDSWRALFDAIDTNVAGGGVPSSQDFEETLLFLEDHQTYSVTELALPREERTDQLGDDVLERFKQDIDALVRDVAAWNRSTQARAASEPAPVPVPGDSQPENDLGREPDRARKQTLLVIGGLVAVMALIVLLAVVLTRKTSSSTNDDEPSLTSGDTVCLTMNSAVGDYLSGILTDYEYRSRLQDVYDTAQLSGDSTLIERARDLLAVATLSPGNRGMLTPRYESMASRCVELGFLKGPSASSGTSSTP